MRLRTAIVLGLLLIGACADSGDDSRGRGKRFQVRIENVSEGDFPTPFAPGLWTVHDAPDPFFQAGTPDRGDGLEALAEDGDPSLLAMTLAGRATGTFDTPAGGAGPAPIFPGEAYEFEFRARPADGNLSLALMLVQSNDIIASANGTGIPIFQADGTPFPGTRDVTAQLDLWDAGTEANQAPRLGPDQAPRQGGPDTGSVEGIVRPFADGTRVMPLSRDIAGISVSEAGGTFTFTLSNISDTQGALVTPIAPVFWAVHDGSFSLFTSGSPDTGMGLETLAEDGSPAVLVASYTGATGILATGAQDTTLERPAQTGPAFPGERFQFGVTPDGSHPYVTIAAMVVESNDVFLAFPETGLSLLDAAGAPRSAADVDADARRLLAVWDAGTEANEVPGVGPNQPIRQAGPNTGALDPDDRVRLYDDATNDLEGPLAGGFLDVTVTPVPASLSFDVVVRNTSDGTAYPGLLTPVVHAVHDGTFELFARGAFASAGLEALAEDGSPAQLLSEVMSHPGVLGAAVRDIPDGGAAPGPIGPGESYSFTVTADSAHRYLGFATMVVPSNDTFVAPLPGGIEIVDATGNPRSALDIAADLQSVIAWNAGTEANQAGAAGRDQAPQQAGPNTGAAEGSGTVRTLADPVWSHPPLGDLLKVTITSLP